MGAHPGAGGARPRRGTVLGRSGHRPRRSPRLPRPHPGEARGRRSPPGALTAPHRARPSHRRRRGRRRRRARRRRSGPRRPGVAGPRRRRRTAGGRGAVVRRPQPGPSPRPRALRRRGHRRSGRVGGRRRGAPVAVAAAAWLVLAARSLAAIPYVRSAGHAPPPTRGRPRPRRRPGRPGCGPRGRRRRRGPRPRGRRRRGGRRRLLGRPAPRPASPAPLRVRAWAPWSPCSVPSWWAPRPWVSASEVRCEAGDHPSVRPGVARHGAAVPVGRPHEVGRAGRGAGHDGRVHPPDPRTPRRAGLGGVGPGPDGRLRGGRRSRAALGARRDRGRRGPHRHRSLRPRRSSVQRGWPLRACTNPGGGPGPGCSTSSAAPRSPTWRSHDRHRPDHAARCDRHRPPCPGPGPRATRPGLLLRGRSQPGRRLRRAGPRRGPAWPRRSPAMRRPPAPRPGSTMGPTELVDHLEATHHAYLHGELPRLEALIEKVEGGARRSPSGARLRAAPRSTSWPSSWTPTWPRRSASSSR